jgi:hypothetical protein
MVLTHFPSPVFGSLLQKEIVFISDLVVVMLSIGPMVRGFKPGRGRRILRAIKVRSTPSVAGEVKPSAKCRKILRRVKDPCEI